MKAYAELGRKFFGVSPRLRCSLMLLDRAIDVAEENDWERAVCASQQKIASQGLLLGVEQACCGQDRAARI